MTAPPALTLDTSCRQVAGLRATRTSGSPFRLWYPRGEIRSWYQVGRPSMLEGKTFFGATGIPIAKIARVSTRLADWLPEPLTVAAWKVRSLTVGCNSAAHILPLCDSRMLGLSPLNLRVGRS